MSGTPEGTAAEALMAYGLTGPQVDELTSLQEQGCGIDFRYHFTDDGSDPLRLGSHIDDFLARLRAFAAEGDAPRELAASLWEHVTPRIVGWKPDFAEDVETRHLGYFHVLLDEAIDARLGRSISQSVRAAALDVRERFDDLSFSYETGSWRDSRTSGEVSDELLFVASMDEKLRDVLYRNSRVVDLTREMVSLDATKSPSQDAKLESSFEQRAYQAQLSCVSDIIGRLKGAGVEVRTGLVEMVRAKWPSRGADTQKEVADPVQARTAIAASKARRPPAPRPVMEANAYWRGVAEKNSSTALSPPHAVTQSNTPAVRRGRSI